MDPVDIREKMYEVMESDENTEAFQIDSVESFSWYMGRIELLYHQINRHRAIANKKHEALRKAYETENEKIESDFLNETTQFRNSLQTLKFKYAAQANEFSRAHIATLKGRSFNIGQFRVGFRKSPSRLRITNKEEAIGWLFRHGYDSLVRVQESIDIEKLQKVDFETLPQGMSEKPESDVFYIRFGDKDVTEDLVNDQPADNN